MARGPYSGRHFSTIQRNSLRKRESIIASSRAMSLPWETERLRRCAIS